jgi:NADH:ubiquinone oxidoreductase subunit 6 (subunit J)
VTLLVLQAGAVLLRSERGAAASFDASTRRMAEILFSPHFLYAFEATSILILAALVGAVALAKKEL